MNPIVPPSPSYYLTSQEQHVLRLVADGSTNPDIATHRNISESIARRNVEHLCHRLEAQSRGHLVALAYHHALLVPFWVRHSTSTKSSHAANQYSIPPTEYQVLRLLAEGDSYTAIATKLNRRRSTVNSHLSKLRLRMGAHSQAHLITAAFDVGVLLPNWMASVQIVGPIKKGHHR